MITIWYYKHAFKRQWNRQNSKAMERALWADFMSTFPVRIQQLPHYDEKLSLMACDDYLPPMMLCGPQEVPLRLIWQEAIRRRYQLTALPQPCFREGAEIPHFVHEKFLLIDLMHPQIGKTIHQIPAMLTGIGALSSVTTNDRRIVILEHIDQFQRQQGMEALRVICERFSSTTWFIATTHTPSCIDPAIRSRFVYLRCPAFSPAELTLLTERTPPFPGANLVDTLFYPDSKEHPQWTRGILSLRRNITVKNLEVIKRAARVLSQKLIPFSTIALELLSYLPSTAAKCEFVQKIVAMEERRVKLRSSLDPYCYEQLLWEFFCFHRPGLK